MLKHWEHTEMVDAEQYLLFQRNGHVITPTEDIPSNTAVYVNTLGNKRLEGVYDPVLKGIRPLKDKSSPNRDLRLYIDALKSDHITMLAVDGLMGTGKTSTTVEWVVDTYLGDLKVKDMELEEFNKGDHKILIAKPHVNASGEDYGHLPGGIKEKFDPTLTNFVQYFDRFHQAGYHSLNIAGYVDILPLGFARGLDADNMTIIVDECQNTKELITIATRKAKKSRVIFLGDTSPFQIDLKGNKPDKNGLSDLVELLNGAPYFQYIEMKTLEHIVRSDEVRDIVRRLFKRYGQDPRQWIIK
ncbi:hypothetical protein D1872_50810 [compost metagenome]